MSSQSQQLSLFFIELLSTFGRSSNSTLQLAMLNSILKTDFVDDNIETLVFFGNRNDIEPLITAMPETPKVVSTDISTELQFYNAALDAAAGRGFSSNIIFIAIGSLTCRTLMNHLNKAFANMQGNVRGVFIVPSENVQRSRSSLYEHFDWCWRNGFAYVLVIMDAPGVEGNLDVFSYNRFPNIELLRLISARPKRYFISKFSNLRGYKLRTPVQYDPPRVFEFYDRKTNSHRLKGYAAEIYQAFLKRHNGSLEIVQVHNSSQYDIPGIIEQLNSGNVDFAMNPYIPYVGVRTSYPIKMMQWCVMVPFSGEINFYEYFVRPFRPHAWRACIMALFYLSFMKGLMDWLQGRGQRRSEFGRAFLEIQRMMLFLPMPTTKLAKLFALPYVCSFLLMAVLGFILSNLYLASMTSFLAKTIFERQLNTLAEMVERKIKINALDYEIPIILRNNGLPAGFADLLVPRNASELLQDMLALKTGQAYAAREDILGFVLFQQGHMLRPILHVASECITTVPVAFLMPTHSQFESVLTRFILRAASSGLSDKWMHDAVSDGYRANILHVRRYSEESTRVLSVSHFQFAWLVLLAGMVLAVLSFIAENFKRIKRRMRIFVIYY